MCCHFVIGQDIVVANFYLALKRILDRAIRLRNGAFDPLRLLHQSVDARREFVLRA